MSLRWRSIAAKAGFVIVFSASLRHGSLYFSTTGATAGANPLALATTEVIIESPSARSISSWLPGRMNQTTASSELISSSRLRFERDDVVVVPNSAALATTNATNFLKEQELNATTKNATDRRLVTTLSGCYMASWVFLLPDHIKRRRIPINRDNPQKRQVMFFTYHDCFEVSSKRQLKRMEQLKEGDTIYIPLTKLQGFIDGFLHQITVPVTIISGQAHFVPPEKLPSSVSALVHHPMLIAWFCHNLDIYANDYIYHPKVHPWPYGFADYPFRHLFGNRKMYREVVRNATQQRKDTVFFHAHFEVIGDRRTGRLSIPNGPAVSQEAYYRNVARSRFIFSPNGDRPECYRHYEAIGLGTIPITQLDPWIHRHLQGSVVCNNTNWNISYWNSSSVERDDSHELKPNPEMVFEDYWKLYAEREAKRSLNWATPSVWLNDTYTEVKSPAIDLTDGSINKKKLAKRKRRAARRANRAERRNETKA